MHPGAGPGNLSHPHIVTIYEVGEDKGVTYIAMEYIEGRSLEEFMASGKRFSLEVIINLVGQIGEALDYAHSRGVIHRDIKPANILIDEEARAHIVDFGIARFTSSTMTFTRAIIGTPYFMSPEQITGNKNIDHRTDIFSLGTLLYEMLTGDKPFSGDSITSVMYKIVHEPHPPANDFRKDLPRQIDTILSKALAKKPQNRYNSCAELTSALREAKDQPEVTESFPAPEEKTEYPHAPPVRKEESKLQESEESEPYEPSQAEKSNKPILFLLLGMMAVVAVVTVSVYIYFSGQQPSISQGGGGSSSVSTRPSAGTYLQAGEVFLKKGEYKEALTEFRKALKRDSRNFEARLGAADALRELDRPIEAAQEYEKAVALDAEDSRPYLHLGKIHDELGEEDKALAFYGHFLDISPEHADARMVSQRVEQIEEKLSAFPEVQPEEKETPSEKKPAEEESPQVHPVKKKEKRIQDQPEPDTDRMFSQGIQAFREGDYKECIRRMEAILKYDSSHSQAKYYLSAARKSMEKEAKLAEEKQKTARKIEDVLRKAEQDFKAGNYHETIKQAEEVLRLDPENSQAREYIDSADIKIAQSQVKAIVDSYVWSIKNNNWTAFYQKRCVPSLFKRIRKDTDAITKLYQNFQAMASNVKTDIRRTESGGYEARVSFSHILTGISVSKQTREILFEGTMTWTMKKQMTNGESVI